MQKILVTQFYIPKETTHLQELIKCITINLKYFDKIILFCEKEYDLQQYHLNDSKIVKIIIDSRLTFKNAFAYTNQHYSNNLCVIANSDIYFDDTIKLSENIKKQEIYCLSRYNYNNKTKSWYPFLTPGSFDAWIYLAPLDVKDCDFPLGVCRCDSVLAYQLKIQGFNPTNPSKSIRIYHLDSRPIRQKTWIDKPVVAGKRCGLEIINLSKMN